MEPAGRYPCCLHCPPVAERRPLSVRFDADHPRASLSGPRGGDRLLPSARLRSRIPGLTVSVARSLAGPVSSPEDRPRSNRPAIRRTMPDGRTGRPRRALHSGSVRGRRYHRTIPLRTPVCRYGEYESSKIADGANDPLAWISYQIECTEATNQRKLLCHNDLSMIRGAPRCRQTVPRISSNLNPSKGAR